MINHLKKWVKRMSIKIVECIPNFSEARRPEVVEQIKAAIVNVDGVRLLDQHSDLDHNRTVLTFVGDPQSVERAAFQAIQQAGSLIDLDQHQGEHPRIGATDVVPFVPIKGVSMEECIAMAERVGERVSAELGIPVYLYEEAARRPERRNLENIRRGEYETLKDEIATDPQRAPDFGPLKLGPAGATVIGARHPLIAFNVYLTSADVEIAKRIAKTVRHSSGGLRYVKALGLLVEGKAQVSMNLTNYQRTALATVVELIRREAERYGVGIHHSELVGLIPQDALVEASRWYLQLDQFEPDQILEYRLASAQSGEKDLRDSTDLLAMVHSAGFLDALAAGTPTPGGGSAAAYSGAAGAALVAMVARLTIGKSKYAQVEDRMEIILERAEELRAELTEAIQQDATAFNKVMAAFRMSKDNPKQKSERDLEIQVATIGAAQVPLDVAGMAVEVIELALEVVEKGNSNAISDGASGAALARAALTSAGYNVRINTLGLSDRQVAEQMEQQLVRLEKRAVNLEARIRTQLSERGGISLG